MSVPVLSRLCCAKSASVRARSVTCCGRSCIDASVRATGQPFDILYACLQARQGDNFVLGRAAGAICAE